MYKFTVLALLVVASGAYPAGPVSPNVPVPSSGQVHHEREHVPIVNQESVVEPGGKFHFSYESGDGSKVAENGDLRQVSGQEQAGEAVQGQYQYAGDDGKVYQVEYTADENGFQPHGEHIPTSPPVPEAIARALKWAEEHPYHEEEEVARGKGGVVAPVVRH